MMKKLFLDFDNGKQDKRTELISNLFKFIQNKDIKELKPLLLNFKHQFLMSDIKTKIDFFIECVKQDHETTLTVFFTDDLIEHMVSLKDNIIQLGLTTMANEQNSEYLDVLNFFDDNALDDIVNFYETDLKDYFVNRVLKKELEQIQTTVEGLKETVLSNINDSVDVLEVKAKVDWLTEKLGKFSLLTYRDTIQASLTATQALYQDLILENKKNNENNLMILDGLITEVKELNEQTTQQFFPEVANKYLSGYENYLTYLIEEKRSILPILDVMGHATLGFEIDRLTKNLSELAFFKQDFKLDQLSRIRLGHKAEFLKKIQAIMEKIPLLTENIKNPITINDPLSECLHPR